MEHYQAEGLRFLFLFYVLIVLYQYKCRKMYQSDRCSHYKMVYVYLLPVPIYRFRQEDILLYNYDYYSCIQLVMKSNQKFVVLQIILFYLRVSFAGHCQITHVQFTAFYSCYMILLKILQHGTETDINFDNVDILFVPCYFRYCSL